MSGGIYDMRFTIFDWGLSVHVRPHPSLLPQEKENHCCAVGGLHSVVAVAVMSLIPAFGC